MIRINIGDKDSFPPDIIKFIGEKFRKNAELGIFPKVYMIDKQTMISHEVSSITEFGVFNDGTPAIDIGLNIALNLDQDTGEIISAVMADGLNENGTENKE